jgi:LL-diaminopimelate aminotransferase
LKVEEELLFPWIHQQKNLFLKTHQLEKCDLINLGIGDTCHNLPNCITKALIEGVKTMGKCPIGYGPEQGNPLFRKKIAQTVYFEQKFSEDEIFITEGIANALPLLLSLFAPGSKVGILSPTYPGYRSLLEVMELKIIEIAAKDDFSFSLPTERLDCMILCTPNNPTGIAFTKEELTKWVEWANRNGTIILLDGAYESFITSENIPKSIYEIPGAKTCSIEMRSFSKSIGFSGLRLGYFIVPKECGYLSTAQKMITVKTNGVSFLSMEGGIAALSEEGLYETQRLTSHYRNMTKKLKEHLLANGQNVIGGIDAPYLFWQIEGSSKEAFLKLLYTHRLVTVPGIGFGREGFLRLSGFISENTLEKAKAVLTLSNNHYLE